MAFAGRPARISHRRRRRHDPIRGAALGFVVVGLFLIFTFVYGLWRGYMAQEDLNHAWLAEVDKHQTAPPVIDPSLQHPVNGIDFAIRVPRLGYFAAVREGIDSGSLYSGPGHYPTTVWPGSVGMVGVAAHNVYWINFPQLQRGDEIDLETRYGVYRYRVTGSRIVNPDDRTVLLPDSSGSHLTLTTCWPLWAGAFATQRYVIFTTQVSPAPAEPAFA
jgi:LPXTG-site transpeptidase (sortase) family protein